MVGILITFVYAAYAYLAWEHTFAQIHLVTMNFLFYWYLVGYVATILWFLFTLVCGLFGLRFFQRQANASDHIMSIGAWLAFFGLFLQSVRYFLMLAGTKLLYFAYNGETWNNPQFVLGFILLLLGLMFRFSVKRTYTISSRRIRRTLR